MRALDAFDGFAEDQSIQVNVPDLPHLLHFFSQRRDDVEQIAHDRIVGDFEDRRLGVLVHGDDGPRAFHAHDVLNGAADAEREIKLGRDRLARRADLAVHGEPAGVADGARGRQFAAERLGELLGHLDVFLLFDAAADGDDDFGLREIDGLLGFLEDFLRLVANDAIGNFDADGFDRSCARSGFGLVSAKSSVLERGKPGSVAGEADVGGELALEHLAGEDQLSVFVFEADAVADDGASHGGGELGDEVAYLIGVRHQYELRLLRGEELFERGGEGVGRVRLELR